MLAPHAELRFIKSMYLHIGLKGKKKGKSKTVGRQLGVRDSLSGRKANKDSFRRLLLSGVGEIAGNGKS